MEHMQTYLCDVCNKLAKDLISVEINNKEHDLCRFCYEKTVGKIKNGRIKLQWKYIPPVFQVVPLYQPYYFFPHDTACPTPDLPIITCQTATQISCSVDSESKVLNA